MKSAYAPHHLSQVHRHIKKIASYGIRASAAIVLQRARRYFLYPYYMHKHRFAPRYPQPTPDQLAEIEKDLDAAGIFLSPLRLSPKEFQQFKEEFSFPVRYYGLNNTLRNEKLLEHFIAYKLCDLQTAIHDRNHRLDNKSKSNLYVDVAGGGSPWVKILRDKGANAFAIDLKIPPINRHFNYYRQMDAKNTDFDDSTVASMSLQCAYEMFLRDDDVLFVDECHRVLRGGGKVVIVPLYMHTHYCGYSSPEYYKKGYADIGAAEYIREDCWGIPFSRKYDVLRLKERIISRAEKHGMRCTVHVLRNKEELGKGIYCHFVIEITKSSPQNRRI